MHSNRRFYLACCAVSLVVGYLGQLRVRESFTEFRQSIVRECNDQHSRLNVEKPTAETTSFDSTTSSIKAGTITAHDIEIGTITAGTIVTYPYEVWLKPEVALRPEK